MNYVMIPSNIFFFILGVISTIIVIAFMVYFSIKKEQKARMEMINKFGKNLGIEIDSKDEDK